MLASFGSELDEDMLRDHLRREDAEDAYEALLVLARSDRPVTKDVLSRELDRLRGAQEGQRLANR